MAKIKTLRFEIKKEMFSININCTTKGLFTANLPLEIYQPLNLEGRLVEDTLELLESNIYKAFNKYKNAATKEELSIFIKYGSGGDFAKKENGDLLSGNYENKYPLRADWGRIENLLGFDFKVTIKETIDGNVNWYNTRLGYKEEFKGGAKGERKTYHKHTHVSDSDKYKAIPFNENYLSTLKLISEKIRNASEILYNFISQDEKVIENILSSKKALL